MFYTGTSESNINLEKDDIRFTKYLIDKSEGKASDYRDQMLAHFNSEFNKNGEKVKIIIINSAAAEGITIKNVRFVHLLHLPANMSKVFQIIGRAIRNCTHKLLNENEQTVTPILYLSSNLVDQANSDDEKRYDNIIASNRTIVPFLNILKQSTIDCLLNTPISGQNCFITDPNVNSNNEEWEGYRLISTITNPLPEDTSTESDQESQGHTDNEQNSDGENNTQQTPPPPTTRQTQPPTQQTQTNKRARTPTPPSNTPQPPIEQLRRSQRQPTKKRRLNGGDSTRKSRKRIQKKKHYKSYKKKVHKRKTKSNKKKK